MQPVKTLTRLNINLIRVHSDITSQKLIQNQYITQYPITEIAT